MCDSFFIIRIAFFSRIKLRRPDRCTLVFVNLSGTPLSHRPKQIHPKQNRCRNRRPQANKTLKTTSPSTPLEKFIPKPKIIKSPSKHRKSYVPKHWLITPQATPKQAPSKPQGIRIDHVIKGAGYANRCA